jgi:hypothetical protein
MCHTVSTRVVADLGRSAQPGASPLLLAVAELNGFRTVPKPFRNRSRHVLDAFRNRSGNAKVTVAASPKRSYPHSVRSLFALRPQFVRIACGQHREITGGRMPGFCARTDSVIAGNAWLTQKLTLRALAERYFVRSRSDHDSYTSDHDSYTSDHDSCTDRTHVVHDPLHCNPGLPAYSLPHPLCPGAAGHCAWPLCRATERCCTARQGAFCACPAG